MPFTLAEIYCIFKVLTMIAQTNAITLAKMLCIEVMAWVNSVWQ